MRTVFICIIIKTNLLIIKIHFMKKQTILKGLCCSVAITGLIATIASCSKENLSPSKLRQTTSVNNNPSSLIYGPLPYGYNPTIYGVQTGGTGGHNLYTIDRNNGAILTQSPINFTGGGGISHGAVLGIAKTPGLQTGYLTVMSSCGGSSQFYSLDFNTKTAVTLGSIFGGGYIKDIECHPISKAVYGIKDNFLVKMTSFGTMCDGTPTGNVPATYQILGDLSTVGVGPYSISFNYVGDCAIMSAKDHNRAYVILPTGAANVMTPMVLNGTRVKGIPTDLYSVYETASCISGTTQFIGIAGSATSTSGYSYDFYKWATNASGALVYQLLDGTIYTGMADYTSETGTGIIIEPK
jgi:hypothetical protein